MDQKIRNRLDPRRLPRVVTVSESHDICQLVLTVRRTPTPLSFSSEELVFLLNWLLKLMKRFGGGHCKVLCIAYQEDPLFSCFLS